ncbi:MAG: ASKHA domain-containing protein [Oscillospiraceae bacterium]
MNVIGNGTQRTIETREGETILAALRRSGIAAPEAPCGGNGTCKKCTVTVDGREVLACRTPAAEDCTVVLPEQNAGAVIASTGRGTDFPLTPGEGLGAAVDIGTTTVVVHLYDLPSGALLGTRSGVNRQRAFGADVISRIQYAMSQPDGLEQLTRAIRGQLNGYLEELCACAGRSLDELSTVTVAANTVMEHIYAGLSPASIATAPFTPLSLFGEWQDGGGFGLPKHTRVCLAPAVAGYVGGDITAGILASGAYRAERPVLFLDVGTNGEMALGSAQTGFLCCATAAGPAFEGAAISQGMSACDGAISRVERTDGKVAVTVLGGGAARGVCGSGLVDALAVMLELGAVDETGRLLPPDEAPEEALPYLEEDGDGNVRFRLAGDVCITAADVRQLQLAKAAIAAGICTLLDEAGLEEDDVACLYLAGGFGNYIRRESAAAIGLLPASMEKRIVGVGNSAGEGAAAALLSAEARDILDGLRGRCKYLELSGHRAFNDFYIDCMMFE